MRPLRSQMQSYLFLSKFSYKKHSQPFFTFNKGHFSLGHLTLTSDDSFSFSRQRAWAREETLSTGSVSPVSSMNKHGSGSSDPSTWRKHDVV